MWPSLHVGRPQRNESRTCCHQFQLKKRLHSARVLRQCADQLLASIKEKDEAAAVSIIDQNRKTAWMRDEESGNHPIHEAIHQVRMPESSPDPYGASEAASISPHMPMFFCPVPQETLPTRTFVLNLAMDFFPASHGEPV